jgi:hypothetical protein
VSARAKCRDSVEAVWEAISCAIERPATERLEEASFGRYNPEATKAEGWHWHLKFASRIDQDGEVLGDTIADRVTLILRAWDADRLKYEGEA